MSSLLGQSSNATEQQPSPEQHASVIQALLQHASGQPGGLAGMVDGFRQNGMGQHMDSWMGTQPGEQPAASVEPHQVEQGLGSDTISALTQRTGLSSEVVKMALAAGLPLLMSHLSNGSGQLPEQANSGSGIASMAQGLLSHVL